jgi:CRISPR-associated endoribonuclease Cas6
MKIHLTTTPNSTVVSFNYQKNLAGAFHKWLGKNDIHDGISLYSYSWLKGSTATKNQGLDFRSGSVWSIGAYDPQIIRDLIEGIRQDPSLFHGMEVLEVVIQEDIEEEGKCRFLVDSPVFVKRKEGARIKYFLHDEPGVDQMLTETLQHKLKIAGLDAEGLSVAFDTTYPRPKTKYITYNGIGCRASLCPVIVQGSKEQLAFAWNVGVGNSTGIGFGALR